MRVRFTHLFNLPVLIVLGEMKPRNLIIFLGLLISGCNCQLKSDEDIEDNSGMLAITKNQFQTHKSPIAGYRGTDEFISSNRSLSNVNETELESNGTRKGKCSFVDEIFSFLCIYCTLHWF